MVELVRRFQLDQIGQGLSCDERGLALAGIPLMRKTASGFEARPTSELTALTPPRLRTVATWTLSPSSEASTSWREPSMAGTWGSP